MFIEERQAKILELLERDGKVLVKELAEIFSVTEDSIRKDLSALELDGKLKRTYGGAVSIEQKLQMTEANKRRISDVEAKRKIAAAALRLHFQRGRTLQQRFAQGTEKIFHSAEMTLTPNSCSPEIRTSNYFLRAERSINRATVFRTHSIWNLFRIFARTFRSSGRPAATSQKILFRRTTRTTHFTRRA